MNAGARGADAAALANALLQLGNLKVLQLHSVGVQCPAVQRWHSIFSTDACLSTACVGLLVDCVGEVLGFFAKQRVLG